VGLEAVPVMLISDLEWISGRSEHTGYSADGIRLLRLTWDEILDHPSVVPAAAALAGCSSEWSRRSIPSL
jgi:hypothetical protein